MSRKAVIIIFLTIDQCTGQAGAAAAKTRAGVSCLGARGDLPSPRPPSPAHPGSWCGEQNDSINDEIINYDALLKSDTGQNFSRYFLQWRDNSSIDQDSNYVIEAAWCLLQLHTSSVIFNIFLLKFKVKKCARDLAICLNWDISPGTDFQILCFLPSPTAPSPHVRGCRQQNVQV